MLKFAGMNEGMKSTGRIKMIWDFRGPNAGPIARHHEKHLIEFAENEGLYNVEMGTEVLSPNLTIAFLICDEPLALKLRDKLKPHRGQNYTES